MRNCPKCPAEIGQPHTAHCPVARCLHTGEQRLMHWAFGPRRIAVTARIADVVMVTEDEDNHDCGSDLWTGEMPGVVEARAFGWWCRPATTADAPLTGWIPCPPDTPGAVLDLNRLFTHAIWDQAANTWHQAAPTPAN